MEGNVQIIVGIDGGTVRYLEVWRSDELAWRRYRLLAKDLGIEEWDEDDCGVVYAQDKEHEKELILDRFNQIMTEWPEHWKELE